MSDILVRLESACFGANGKHILKQVSLELKRGTSTFILGPNGAGKTTLLRMIAGLLPYSGSITIDHAEVRDIPRARLSTLVTLVPQRLEYVPALPVSAFIELSGGLSPHVASFAGISSLLNAPMNILSGGELQKVLLAGAVAQGAALMLLDEPTANVDPKGRRVVAESLRTIATLSALTRVTVSHDVQLAVQYATDIVVMKEGAIVWRGAPRGPEFVEAISDAYETNFSMIERPGGHMLLIASEGV